jgi:hypothetical protein
MSEFLGVISIIRGLDNDSLAASEASRKNNNNFTTLDAAEKEREGERGREEETGHLHSHGDASSLVCGLPPVLGLNFPLVRLR